MLSGAAEFKDEEIVYTDTFYRLSTGYPRENDEGLWIYPYLWNDGAYLIETHPITGTGPDNWSEMYESLCTTDRSFNEYIDVGMQRGLICLALYVVFLLITLKKMGSAAAAHLKDENCLLGVSRIAVRLCRIPRASVL